MCRNSKYIVICILAAAFVCTFAARPRASFAQNDPAIARSSYEVISSSPGEIVLHIHPDFKSETVTDPVTSEHYVNVNFSGSTTPVSHRGSPAVPYLDLSVLVPDESSPASVEIVSKQTKQIAGILAPIPTPCEKDGTLVPQYIRNAELYSTYISPSISEVLAPRVLRTAFVTSVIIHPVTYDVANGITLVTDLVVRIRTANASRVSTAQTFSAQEEEYFRSLCVNGDDMSLYRSAVSELSKGFTSAGVSYKTNSTTNEQWFSVSTTDEGVYRITASDLAKAGATNIDPSTVAVYGYGAGALPEAIDSLTGELHECAVDVRANGDGSFAEVRFFSQGPVEWRYEQPSSGNSRLFGLYHLMNPYTTAGHFLLKVGGSPASKRIPTKPDVISDSIAVVDQSTVQTVALHEAELTFEEPNISREFVGESVPVGRTVTVGLPDLPGYTPDSTVVRPAFNSHATQTHLFDVSINGQSFPQITDGGTITPGSEPYMTRNWSMEYLVPSSLGAPSSLVLSAEDNELSAAFWLNFAEVFYRRSATLANGQIPFMLYNDASAYHYNFSNATDGEIWDVTNSTSVMRLATASSDNIDLKVKGVTNSLRRFYAFTSSELKSAAVASIAIPSLRSGVCTQGAQEIIIAPQSMLAQANALAKLRRMGGQATDALSVAVVTLEDIYREFGYGANDATSIRDFIKATVRRSAVNNGTVPLYICLFGGGHVDYQNRTTSLPVNIPVYEWWQPANVEEFRSSEPTYDSDDGYYVQLSENSRGIYNGVDIPIGRIAVLTSDEGNDYVAKVTKYETSSDNGAWRSLVTFICDDRYYEDLKGPDPLYHITDTENEVAETPDRLSFIKIYGQAYPNVFSAGGRRKPEMEAAIVDAFNSGSAVISYVGHGNPTIWANESILSVPSTINKFTNINRLAFVTTATCDFSRYDDYAAKISGGVQMLKKPDGGAIALLATCRSVYGGDQFAPDFYKSLFAVPCTTKLSTLPIGVSYVYGRSLGNSANRDKYFILGDPAQRLIVPRSYFAIDSINGVLYNEQSNSVQTISALSLLKISGHVSNQCDGSDLDATFNGSMNVTLYDSPSKVSATSTFTESPPITDTWQVDGPILYSGTATVSSGRFNVSFVVSKDIKFDTAHAKIKMLGYSDNFRSALGVAQNIRVFGIDTTRINADHTGPELAVYIGTRSFHSGDIVPVNSVLIVDVNDESGLNTSTSGIGHSFVGWTDDSTAGTIDLAANYVAQPNDFTKGTTVQQVNLPLGLHTMNVRAFDAAGNPSFASVQFTAASDAPYKLFNVTIYPNPVRRTATFTFEQPAPPEFPVDVTLDLYNAIGGHVRTISVPSISSNVITIPFDGNDDGGGELIDGMYLYRLQTVQRLNGIATASGGTFIVTHD